MKGIAVALSLTVAAAALLGAGCAGHQPFECPKTPIYAHFVAPVSAESKAITSSKVGRCENKAYVCLISVGDASVEKAAKDAGIKTVNHVEYEYENILFLFQRTCIIVHGD